MSLLWVVLGVFIQCTLAMFLFMFVAFSAAGVANGGKLTKMKMAMLNASIYFVPGTALLSAVMIVVFYNTGGSALVYWWHAFPLIVAVFYYVYVMKL